MRCLAPHVTATQRNATQRIRGVNESLLFKWHSSQTDRPARLGYNYNQTRRKRGGHSHYARNRACVRTFSYSRYARICADSRRSVNGPLHECTNWVFNLLSLSHRIRIGETAHNHVCDAQPLCRKTYVYLPGRRALLPFIDRNSFSIHLRAEG